ncbi:CHAD domain-containing protein [Ilumatobacter nonamiensis]|uniref:CHAD domain-containing protein n=1 Tax=Ilumatobacter nonamiensis TaxID=467093 RepID=UPI0003455C51|nr:CHAD domain-containing protein [Ilumatobacter nonamiensis]
MAYRFLPDEAVLDGIQRIAREQVDRALTSLDWETGRSENVEDGIHECRKRCKRIRGAVRLVRPALADGQYAETNETFRDAARALSPYRDAHALLTTFEELIEGHAEQFVGIDVDPIRAELDRRSRSSTEHLTGDAEPVRIARDLLVAGRSGIDDWRLDSTGWDALGGGLAKTYGRGRRALAVATDAPTPENFHQWRKRVKYSWNHLRILRTSAPTLIEPWADSFKSLSDALGAAHDLAVLREEVGAEPDAFGGNDAVDAVAVIADGRRADLERRSIAFGSRLYAEQPKHFARRLGTYWTVWHDLGDEPAVGEIAELST